MITEKNSFYLFAKKSWYYCECLKDIINFLDRHSESIKHNKLNTAKGYKRILTALQNNVERFAELGDDIEVLV